MSAYNIAVLAGDGIGREVVEQASRVLQKAAELDGFEANLVEIPWSSQYLIDEGHLVQRDGTHVPNQESPLYTSDNGGGLVLPDEFFTDLVKGYDSMLFGAVGDPRVKRGVVERAIIGGLRWHPSLGLYVNLRPVKLYSDEGCLLKDVTGKDLDIVIVRENLEGLYTSTGVLHNRGTQEEYAARPMLASRKGTEKIIRYAFEYARAHGRKTVTLVDKANVMAGDVGLIWREAFEKTRKDYGDIDTNARYIDDAAAELGVNPRAFDVIVTSNLFGDILSDVASALTGARGMAGSGNINPKGFSVFEPNHGTAPDLKPGEANPLGTIFAVKLMLQHLGKQEQAETIDRAVQSLFDDTTFTLDSFTIRSDRKLSSEEITDCVLERMS